MKKLRVIRERRFCPHHILLTAANIFLKHAEEDRRRGFHYQVAAILFSALTVEALANAYGERLLPDWNDRRSPIAKLRAVCTHLGIDFRPEKTPWSAVIWTVKFRNRIAHARPQFVKSDKVMSSVQFEKKGHDRPASKIETQITYANAKRSVDTVCQVGSMLIEKLPYEEYTGLVADAWNISTNSIPEE